MAKETLNQAIESAIALAPVLIPDLGALMSLTLSRFFAYQTVLDSFGMEYNVWGPRHEERLTGICDILMDPEEEVSPELSVCVV